MDRLNWKNLLEGLGALALIASLLFVGYQLRQDRQLAAAQVIAAADSVQIEMAALIAENRDAWLRGLKGEKLSEVDDMAFRAVAEALFRKHRGVYQRVQLLGFPNADRQAQMLAIDLYQYPKLRQAYMQNEQLSNAQRRIFNSGNETISSVLNFDAVVNEHLAELDRSGPLELDRTFFPF